MAPRITPAPTRFWAKVRKSPSGCWNWTAALTRPGKRHGGGYGRFRLGSTHVLAHRYAYELAVGPIPEGLDLDHLCRNRACVNPDHLEPVTRAVNVTRALRSRAVA